MGWSCRKGVGERNMWCLGWVVEALVFVRCAFGCRPILLEMLGGQYSINLKSRVNTGLS